MLGLAYLLMSVLVVAFELLRKKNYAVDFLTIANLFYLLAYFVQGASIELSSKMLSDFYLFFQSESIYLDRIDVFVVTIISYLFLCIGYYSDNIIKRFVCTFKIRQQYKNFDKHLIALLSVIFLASFALYTHTYGGYMNALALSNLLRSGHAEIATFSFVKPLLFSGTVLCIFLGARVKGFFDRNAFVLLVFLLLTTAAYALLAGRAHLVLLFGFTIYSIVDGRIRFWPTVIGATLFYLLMVYGDALFAITFYLDSEQSITEIFNNQKVGEQNFFVRLIHEFQYAFCSLAVSIDDIDFSMLRFEIDRIIALISFLPDRLVGFSPPDSIAYINTERVFGIYDSMCPPGILAYYVYSYHYIGIVFGPLLFGVIGGAVNGFFEVNKEFRWIRALQLYTAYQWGGFVLSGEPRVDFIAFFMLNFVLLIILFRIFLLPKLIHV